MSSKQKNQHIKVFARVRPRNSLELRSQVVVDVLNQKEISVKDKGQVKNFAFDRVFGPESKQVDVYKAVVAPLISEVLQGYNCTVFAYGQTGTGKTFTMVGDKSKGDNTGGWQNDPLSGIVPRTLDHLFDELKVRAEEFTVRISFLELYNEELCDLLAPLDNDDTKTLRLFEDSMKKGSVIVSGLEERTVYEKNDVYPILEAGSLRRQTAPTLMNASSSRSHTIFTITVHVKVTTPEGEDLFKTGKLNLVDLAGSENIGRSGAVDMRAREAGNINQSLLTLGRVITSLVERTPHVPYRESKLTRILQDSLGGRTKTSIIATVSPALCNLEETLSTFDYAHRARNITNKPEINQKMSKHVLLKNYTDEIERLRRDLIAAREKHGVYLLSEDYNSMISQIDNLNKDLVNKIQMLKVREDDLIKQEEIMQSLNMDLHEVKNDLAKNVEIIQIKQKAIEEREGALQELSNQAQVLLRTADEATEDSKRLHDRLDRAKMVHTHNEELVDRFKSRFINNLQAMKQSTQSFQSRGNEISESLMKMNVERSDGCRENQSELKSTFNSFLACLTALLPNLSTRLTSQIEKSNPSLGLTTEEVDTIGKNLGELCSIISTCMKDSQASRDPIWSSLSSLLAKNMESNDQTKRTLEDAHGHAENCAGILSTLPEQLQEKAQEEEAVFSQLKGRNDELQTELRAISNEREALLAREKAAWEAKQVVDAALAEQEKRVREAKQQAARAVAQDASVTITALLQSLTLLANINGAVKDISEQSILPVVDDLRTKELQERERLNEQITENLKKSQESCEEIVKRQKVELTALDDALTVGRQALADASAAIESFDNSSHELFETEEKRLNDCDLMTQTAYRNLGSEISAYCDQSFANIHDRTTELKVHLKEEYQKDEKTGNTPQRKEFHYPKKLITTGKFNDSKENVAPRTSLSQSQNETNE